MTKTPQKSNVQSSSRNNNSLVSSILHVSIMFYCVPVFILKSFFDSLDSVILSEANNLDNKKNNADQHHTKSLWDPLYFLDLFVLNHCTFLSCLEVVLAHTKDMNSKTDLDLSVSLSASCVCEVLHYCTTVL